MYQKVKAYVEEHRMLENGDKVIVGVSGGADSICLLFMLLRLRREIPIELVAVHVNHGLRGDAADADEAYVRRVCDEQGVELVTFYENVRAHAKKYGMTEEEAGRELRRRSFEKVLREVNATKIALAHHMNDNAETVLFHLCRGSGLKGLGGIAPVTGCWIRPLLCLKRQDIESYLENWGISYCMDATNLEDIYARNKIRNQIIPALMTVNAKAVEHMAETAEKMRELWEYIGAETMKWKSACIQKKQDGRVLLVEEQYERIPEALRSYVLHDVICMAAGHSKDIEAGHVRQTEELLNKQVGRKIALPYGVTAKRGYEGICFSKGERKEAWEEEGEFRFRILKRTEGMDTFPQKIYTKWFDYDIIKSTVKIRHREPGDYITIDKAGNTQKLKQYFVNEKIPQEMRDGIWLVADEHHIMWIVGYRQNQNYQVTDDTRRILEIEFCGGKSDVRNSKSND